MKRVNFPNCLLNSDNLNSFNSNSMLRNCLKSSLKVYQRASQLRNLFFTQNYYQFTENLEQQFHRSRLLRQQNKQQIIYNPEPQRLIRSPIDLKYLVPTNIFEEQVTIEEYGKIMVANKTQNHFQNSYVSINLDIVENNLLKKTLIRFDGKSARIGRLLQVMDMIASLVSYRHCFGSFKKNNPFTLVTGSVQSLQFFQTINTQQDIQIDGFVNNTGKTSMEIEVNITQSNKLKANSFFTMVSRYSDNLSKGYEVPHLDISHLPQEQARKAKIRKQLALQHINRRKKQMAQSFDVRPPSYEEVKEIHELFLLTKNSESLAQSHLRDQVKISSTYMETNGIMHLQDRNINGKIFGGFLMRQMLQIGWVAGMKFLKGQTFAVSGITDIYFLSAVQVGDGLTIGASITYTQGKISIITVHAYTTNFKSGYKKMCCTCQLILQTKINVRNVYPCSYEQALTYLNSRRTFSKMFKNVEFNI